MVLKNNKYYDDDGNELNYIATTDSDTAEYLRKNGFQEIQKDGDRVVFLNNADNTEAHHGLYSIQRRRRTPDAVHS